MLTITAIVTSVLSFLVIETFLRFEFLPEYPEFAPDWDYALFYVLANGLVAIAAFSCIVLFFRAQRAAPADAATLRDRLAD